MSDAPLTLFMPFGTGYGNPGLTVRADSAKELDSILKDLTTAVNAADPDVSQLDAILDGIQTVRAAALLKFPQEEKPVKPTVTHPQAQSVPADAPSCNHGPMKWKEGTSRSTGKSYKGWFCTAPQGTNQCSPQFVR